MEEDAQQRPDLPFVHIGVIVPRLEDAIVVYERLGIRFMEPRVVHVDRLVEGGGESELDLRIVFSLGGPPNLELIEAVGEGIYGGSHVGGLHHVAILDSDPARTSAQLVAQGLGSVAAQYRRDGSMIVSYIEGVPGVRIELLDAVVQDAITAWIRGEDAEP